MQLTVKGNPLRLRSLDREIVKLSVLYYDHFKIRAASSRNGFRITRDGEVAIQEMAVTKDRFSVRVKFKQPPSDGFRGVMAALLGMLLHAVRAGQFEFQLVPDECDLPSIEVTEEWGTWAYQKLHDANPERVPSLIGTRTPNP